MAAVASALQATAPAAGCSDLARACQLVCVAHGCETGAVCGCGRRSLHAVCGRPGVLRRGEFCAERETVRSPRCSDRCAGRLRDSPPQDTADAGVCTAAPCGVDGEQGAERVTPGVRPTEGCADELRSTWGCVAESQRTRRFQGAPRR